MTHINRDSVSGNGLLEGKYIVVTGACGLLGREHTHAILEAGGFPILLDLDQEALMEFSMRLRNAGFRGFASYTCDISSEDSVEGVVEEILKLGWAIWGIVSNADINPKVEDGAVGFRPLEELSLADWNRQIEVGLTGLMLCAKHFGRLIASSGEGGSIVVIGSYFSIRAPNQTQYKEVSSSQDERRVKPFAYSVVKHGQLGAVRYLSTYWAHLGIRVNLLSPGSVDGGLGSPVKEALALATPLGRLANPSEFRSAIIFLLSDDSSYMTGANLVMDGGRSVW